MSNKTIKISEKNYNKIMDIRDLKGLKSADNVITTLLPEGIVDESYFEHEQPAFTIKEKIITWTMLKDCEIGAKWGDGNLNATVLFKDEFGALIRFQEGFDFYVNYYHFI